MRRELLYAIPVAGMIAIPILKKRIAPGVEAVTYGATKTIKVTVKNTGELSFSGKLGITIAQEVSGSGCDIWIPGGWYYDEPDVKDVSLNSGETKTYTWSINMQSIGAPEGTLYVIAKVYKGTELKPENCVAGAYKSFTLVGPRIEITGITVS